MTSASYVFQASSLTTDSILRRRGAGITGFQAGYAAEIPASVAEMLPVKLGLLLGGLKSSEGERQLLELTFFILLAGLKK